MDPITSNAATAVVNSGTTALGTETSAPKGGSSQFDQIRAQLKQTADALGLPAPDQAAAPVATPAATTAIPPAGGPAKVQQQLAVSRYHIDRIQAQIKADPSASSLQKLAGRLTSVEKQYNNLDVALRQISPDATPQDWLRLQQMANSMNENINVLSKLVDSAASGVKTILQTQI